MKIINNRNERKKEKKGGGVLRKNQVIISLAIMLLSIMPASASATAISCDALYAVDGFDIEVATTYSQGDIMYNDHFVGDRDLSCFTQGEVSVGSDFSIEQSGLILFTHPGQNWSTEQSMTTGYEDATIETQVTGHNTLASWFKTSSITDSKMSCLLSAQTPAVDKTESNNGYTLVEQIGYGYGNNADELLALIVHGVYVRAPGEISTEITFQLEQGKGGEK